MHDGTGYDDVGVSPNDGIIHVDVPVFSGSPASGLHRRWEFMFPVFQCEYHRNGYKHNVVRKREWELELLHGNVNHKPIPADLSLLRWRRWSAAAAGQCWSRPVQLQTLRVTIAARRSSSQHCYRRQRRRYPTTTEGPAAPSRRFSWPLGRRNGTKMRSSGNSGHLEASDWPYTF